MNITIRIGERHMFLLLLFSAIIILGGLVIAYKEPPTYTQPPSELGHSVDEINWNRPLPYLYISGNVGIGTMNPNYMLDINRTDLSANLLRLYRGSNLPAIGFNMDFALNNLNNQITNYARINVQILDNTPGSEDGSLSFQTMQAGSMREAIFISNNGMVGIGIGSPAPLTVRETGNIGIGTASPSTIVHINSPTNTVPLFIQSGNVASGLRFINSLSTGGPEEIFTQGNDIFFETEGTTRLTVHRTGNIGIGTTNPSEKLDISGNVKAVNTTALDTVNASKQLCIGPDCVSDWKSVLSYGIANSGYYIGWGETDCAPGYKRLKDGWMYQAGQNDGYGGDFICSKSKQGTVYIYSSGTGYAWEMAPPCVICIKDDNAGECYTSWGDTECTAPFTSKYSGTILGAGQYLGQWKTSLVCSNSPASMVYRYYGVQGGGLVWDISPSCSECCNDAAGGMFVSWGQYGTTTTPSCPPSYTSLYSGFMFQSGQRDGLGANAVCGNGMAATNEVCIYDGTYKWVQVPCNVCAKTVNKGYCFTVWGASELPSVPSGYSKIYSGSIYSAGAASSGDGGGMACLKDDVGIEETLVYVHDGSLVWRKYDCSVYCSDMVGGRYTVWGDRNCGAGFTRVNSGYMYQGGQYDGFGGELICSDGARTRLYIYSFLTADLKWVPSPPCAECIKDSSLGECYTAYGSNRCHDGYAPVYNGFVFQAGVGPQTDRGYGQGTVCISDKYDSDGAYMYLYHPNFGNRWNPPQPCVTCCAVK